MSQAGQFLQAAANPPIETITGDTGGAIGPTAGNINLIGGTTGLTFDGNAGTSTITLGGVLGVPNGGTGNTSFTAFSVITAGTTSTNPFQNVSGLGTSGQVLTSNGAGLLPTWQAASASGIITINGDVGSVTGNPVTLTGGTTGAVFTGVVATMTMTFAGITANAGVVNLGTDNAANAINIGLGTTARAIHIGDSAAAHVITIGSTTGAASITERVGTGNYSLDGVAGSTYTVGASTTTGTITIGGTAQTGTMTLGRSTAANSILIQSGVNTGAQITSIANGATAANSTVNILSGAGTAGNNSLLMANNVRTDTIDLGNVTTVTTGRTLTIMNGNIATAITDTLNIGTGTVSGNAAAQRIFNIGTGAQSNGIRTINIGTDSVSGGTQNVNIATGSGSGATTHGVTIGSNTNGTTSIRGGAAIDMGPSSTTGTILIGGSAQTGLLRLGNSSATNIVGVGTGEGATTVNIATGTTNAKAVNIATGAVANVVIMGSTSGAASMALRYGTADYTLASATGTVMSALDTGEITWPLQPAFLAGLGTTDSNVTGNGTVFTLGSGNALTEIFDVNADFNTNGTFTAPVTGKYRFNAAVLITGNTIATDLRLTLVTSNRNYNTYTYRAAGTSNLGGVISALCDMDAADTCTLAITVSGEAAATSDVSSDATNTWFGGSLEF